jgi:hypothetical protein
VVFSFGSFFIFPPSVEHIQKSGRLKENITSILVVMRIVEKESKVPFWFRTAIRTHFLDSQISFS